VVVAFTGPNADGKPTPKTGSRHGKALPISPDERRFRVFSAADRQLAWRLGLGDIAHQLDQPCHGYANACVCPNCLDRVTSEQKLAELHAELEARRETDAQIVELQTDRSELRQAA
jgi:hypothetical protein